MQRIMLEASRMGHRLFRVNAGMGWTGSKIIRFPSNQQITITPSDIVIRNARPFHGVPKGVSDLIGFAPYVVTNSDVGRKLAVFSAGEIKSASGRTTKNQRDFLSMVKSSGGFANIYRSVSEYQEFFKDMNDVS